MVRGVFGELCSRIGDGDEVLTRHVAFDPLHAIVEIALKHLRLGGVARLRRDDEERLADIDLLLQVAYGRGHGGVEDVELRITIFLGEGAAKHLGTQTRSAHAQHYGIFELGLANFLRERDQFGNMRLHGLGNLEPAQRVADDLLVLGIVLPHRGVLLPHAGDDLLLVEILEGAFEIVLILAERCAVTRDDGAHHLDATGFDHFEQLVERLRKRGHALFGQLGGDRRHVDADRLQFVEDVMGFLESGLQRRLCGAVIAEGVQGRWGNGVHRVGADQGIEVHGVGIRRILGAGGRPQRALHPGAFFLQLGETVAAEDALERLVGQLGVGDRSLAQEGIDALLLLIVGGFFGELSKLLVHHAVNAADEEAGHRGDTVHRQPGGDAALQCLDVGLSDLLVHFDREDERDVDVQAGERAAPRWPEDRQAWPEL